jgi:serine phosphatase RsbU (regulator of sigma subunit)/putative methionine-R-sulfoxide reductase with GAF domain
VPHSSEPLTEAGANETDSSIPSISVTAYGLLVGLIGLGLAGYVLLHSPGKPPWPAIGLFAGFSLLVKQSSRNPQWPAKHGLVALIDVAAVLALGPAAGASVTATSGLADLGFDAVRRRQFTFRQLLAIPLFDAGLKAGVAWVAGLSFGVIAGPAPVPELSWATALGTAVLCLVWVLLDQLGWATWNLVDGGWGRLGALLRRLSPKGALARLLPLPFGLLIALVYTNLGGSAFALGCVAILAVSLLAQRWSATGEALQQRVAELSTVEQVGGAIAQAQLDVDKVCELMYTHASQVADATIFHLGLFEQDEYTIKLWMRQGRAEPQRTFRLTAGEGLVNWLRETRQPLLIRDFQREMDLLPAKPVYVSERPPRSALFVPLLAGEAVIGTMSLQSFKPNAYGSSDLRILTTMANQAAVAIQKARMYAQERKRVRQLETIGQVSRQVAAILELDLLFQQVVDLIHDNFGYYHVGLFTADPENQTVTFQASASTGDRQITFDVAWGEGLIGWVAAHRQPALVEAVDQDPRYRCIDALDETQSELVVPLLLEQELVGILDVQSDRSRGLTDDDLFILSTVGDQVAIAIHEARLYEAEQRQAWLSTVLLQVADSMSQVSDLDAVLTTIVRLTPLLAGVDRCVILLWQEETETFRPAQAYGLSPQVRDRLQQMVFPAGAVPALDLVRWDRTPLLVRTEAEEQLIPRELAQALDIREMAMLPLVAQGQFLGTMMVDYAGQTHSFDEQTIDMLTGISNQAGIVIQSAHLLQAQQEEAYVSTALLQVADAVSRSTDLAESLSTVARITPMLAGVQACAFFLWEQENAAFLPFQQYGLEKESQPIFWDLFLPADGPLGRQLLAREPFGVSREIDMRLASIAKSPESSFLALPLVAKGEVVGGMLVEHRGSVQPLSQRWMDILTGISSQAALAIENHRLLEEVAERERMRQELDVARRIQTSFLPESCPEVPGWELGYLWRSAREVGGDFYDFFPLPPQTNQQGPSQERMGIVIADVADKGVPAALFMALSRTLVRTMALDGQQPQVAIARANQSIYSDTRSDLFLTLFYAVLTPGSGEVVVVNAGHMPPLLVRARDSTVEEIRIQAMALGVLPHVEFEQRTIHLQQGDVLLLYTDGVTDASNPEGERFGRQRLVSALQAHHFQSAQELVARIDQALEIFGGAAAQSDDLTMVILKRT